LKSDIQGRGSTRVAVLLLPVLLVLGFVYVIPLGQIALLSVHGLMFSPAAYIAILQDDIVRLILARTIWIAGVVTVFCFLLGYPIAYLLLKSRARVRPFLMLLVILPLWTSVLVRSYSWMAILGRNGVVNSLLESLGFTDAPIQLLYNRFSVYV